MSPPLILIVTVPILPLVAENVGFGLCSHHDIRTQAAEQVLA